MTLDVFDKINSLPILEVLDTFQIGYTKNGTGYILKNRDGTKDTSFSVDINKNIIVDFGKTGISGGVFDFIGMYILNKSKDELKTNVVKVEVIKLFISKGLIQDTTTKKEFVKSLSNKELLEKFDDFKLNGYKSEVSSLLMLRGVSSEFIQKNSVRIGEVFRDIGFYDNYYCTEFETYQDENLQWIHKQGDKPKNVGVFMFPCYNVDSEGNKELVGLKLRRKDGKTIRGKKSLAVGSTGIIYDEVGKRQAIVVEGEMDYIILKILGFNDVVGNLAGVQSAIKPIKNLLFDNQDIICVYDNDPAGMNGMKSLQKHLNRPIATITFPIREASNGSKISDINDLYKCGYDSKKKWNDLFLGAKPINSEDKLNFTGDFIFLREDIEYYDVKYKRFQSAEKIAKFMGLTGKELFKLVSDKKIPTFEGLCYCDGGKQGHYNTLDDSVIVKSPGEEYAKLHPAISKLIENICGGRNRNSEWLHRSILYKLTHLNDVNIPAVILYGSGGSGKGTFIKLLSKIFGQDNTLNNLKQRDLESSFDSYQGEKLIVEFQEIISGNTMNDKRTLDRIKSLVGERLITINAKHQNVRTVDNIARFHFSSNHPIPIQLDSKQSGNRRFTIIKTGGKLSERTSLEIHEALDDEKVIKQYIGRLYEMFPDVPKLKSFAALDNEEKKNLEDNCESASNTFFEWLEKEYPFIYKLNVKQKNILLSKYCSETGEDHFDIKYRQKNFDLGLSHRYEKKRVLINGKSGPGYYIHKDLDELEVIKSMGEDTPYLKEFKPGQVEKIDNVTF